MRVGTNICGHCGDEYYIQYSGEYCLDTPEEYCDSNYCPKCKKAIIEALATISVNFKNKFVPIENAYVLDEDLKNVNYEYILKLEDDIKIKEKEDIETENMYFDEWVKNGSIRTDYPYQGPKLPNSLFPICRRCYTSLYNWETKECSISGQVSDTIDFGYHTAKRTFSYFYFPSKIQDMKISVNVRYDIINNQIIGYAK
jgi:ribosomal protein L37E